MDASFFTTFYLESVIKIDPFLGCSSTPQLLVPPIDQACTGVAWSHNPGAFDLDGDSISYAMVVPFRDRNTEVLNYRAPNDPKFYTNFNTGNENGTGPPTFSIDPVTGTITWDSPGSRGEYNIAFHIIEWRKVNGVWYQLGYVRRDMQILVEDCNNDRPDLIIPADTCIVAGTVLDVTIFGIDPDNHAVKIEAFSEIFNFPASQSPAVYSPVPGVNDYRPSSPPAQTQLTWNTECIHVKNQPYQVVFKITDNPPTGPRLVTFKTWNITVVGPAPEWDNAQLDLATRQANLTWDPYFCQNAQTIQIWRKVDGIMFTPSNCETGMPEYLGYELIDTRPVKNASDVPITTYTDTNNGKGLAPGARYCYRLVAVFPLPRGGESYVSEDICLDPILADVPVITHVTVERTSLVDGEIRISWRAPFEANTTQFPSPYRYDIYRALGFARGSDSTLVGTVNGDTTFLDLGPNTDSEVYNYSIAAYSPSNGNAFLGSSASASSVRLETDSEVGQISLSWSAFVPWSNQIQTFPSRHLIYRGSEGAVEADLVLIDSVDVLSGGFNYIDRGQWNNTNLVDNEVYCYRVQTRGGYGNPAIAQPLKNFSQIICAQPGDTIPPCKPMAPIPDQPVSCEDYVTSEETCGNNVFSNTITWERAEGECGNDISYYNLYAASSTNGEFILLATNIRTTTYEDENLPSFARCYKLSAVDRSGNESELSDAICFDNCPYYELPNVFSPNGDQCNDLFSAYSNREIIGETGEEQQCITPAINKIKCARFVQRVNFRVYNRWGLEVYTYTSGGERSIYIDWNGRDNSGGELTTGVYYYVAEVTFDLVDPTKRTQTIKGWVHLVK